LCRCGRGDNDLGAAGLKGLGRPLTHSCTDYHLATVKDGENSGMAVWLVIGGLVTARALSVRMLRRVALQFLALDLPILSIKYYETCTSPKVFRNRRAVICWYSNLHFYLSLLFI
jgi:hypothetical protein